MSKANRRPVRRALASVVEMLESRTMLSIAALTDTSGIDNFGISYNPNAQQYSFSGGVNTPAPIAASNFTGFTVTGGGGADTLAIQGSSPALLNDAGADGTTLAITVSSNAALSFGPTENLASLSIGSGATASMLGTGRILVTGSLAISGSNDAWQGQLDLGSNDLIVHNVDAPTAAASLATMTNQLKSGFNAGNGYWNGPGIASTAAAGDSRYLKTLGVILNNNNDTPIYNTFDGQGVLGTDVLIKYTYYGDADLNGKVDGTDYSMIDVGFNSQSGDTPLSGWTNGDFNYDGKINGSDYSLIDNAFNMQSGPPITTSVVSTGEIDLSWSAQPNVGQYEVYRSTNPNFSPDFSSWLATADSNLYVDNQVTPGTTYYYLVGADNSDNTSYPVGGGAATTPTYDNALLGVPQTASIPESTGSALAPAVLTDPTPSGLTATGINDLEILLSWTDNSQNEEGFNIRISTDQANWVTLGDVPAKTTTYTVRGCGDSGTQFLQEGVTYYFQVQASNIRDYGQSGFIYNYSSWSNVAQGQVVVPTMPDTIMIVAGHRQTAGWLEQSWFAPSGQGNSVGAIWKDLVKAGYNVFLTPEADWEGSVVQWNGRGRFYDELNEEISRGWAYNIGLIGYSHGGGTIYNMSDDIYQDRTIYDSQHVVFAATIDAVERYSSDQHLPTSLGVSPGAMWNADSINYWESYGVPAWYNFGGVCSGQNMPAGGTKNTQISFVYGVSANHCNIYSSPVVISGIEREAEYAFSIAGEARLARALPFSNATASKVPNKDSFALSPTIEGIEQYIEQDADRRTKRNAIELNVRRQTNDSIT